MPDSALDADGEISYFPTMSKPAKAGDPAKGALPFEEALNGLESIVESMEGGDLPLETLLKKYEEGVSLAQACQKKLAAAEERLLQLEKNAAGVFHTKPTELESDTE